MQQGTNSVLIASPLPAVTSAVPLPAVTSAATSAAPGYRIRGSSGPRLEWAIRRDLYPWKPHPESELSMIGGWDGPVVKHAVGKALL